MSNAINWEQCLELASGKEEVAKELLDMFVNELPDVSDSLRAAFTDQNLADLEEIVHKLHGGSCYCGVPQLKDAAADLEKYLKTEWPEANSPELSKRYATLITAINEVNESYEQQFA